MSFESFDAVITERFPGLKLAWEGLAGAFGNLRC
jgi:hypothetical protein